MTDVVMSKFASTILEQKYSHIKPDGTKENWDNVAYRVSKNVLKGRACSQGPNSADT